MRSKQESNKNMLDQNMLKKNPQGAKKKKNINRKKKKLDKKFEKSGVMPNRKKMPGGHICSRKKNDTR